MENQIVCPNCGKTVPNNAMIEDAIKGVGSDTQSMNCECGERITYWNMTAQLRDQKTIGRRFRNWVRSLTHSQA
jgi:hypothetical protein